MAKYFTPQLKRYHTSGQTPTSLIRPRNKTVFLQEPAPKIQDQYADLAVQSVKKNYHVSNLKPFVVNKFIFNQLKKQVQSIKQTHSQPNVQNFFDKDQNLKGKITHLVVSALKADPPHKRRTRKNFMRKQSFIQSEIWDDHQLLMEDYRQDIKAERANRKKTIQNLNEKIIKKYPSLVESEGGNKLKLLKFKKQIKATKKYITNQETRPLQKNYQNILDLCKQDYGIYSRSTNRAMYYEDLNKHKYGQKNREVNHQRVRNSLKQLKMEKTFYKSYMGSYSQRKNILRDSQAQLNH